MAETEEIKKLIEAQGQTLDQFMTENNKRLKDIEAKGYTDPVLEEKVKRIADDVATIATLKTQLESVEKVVATMNAPDAGDGKGKPKSVYGGNLAAQLSDVMTVGNPNPNQGDYKAAIDRLGKVQAAASGASSGVPSDGGFLIEKDTATSLNDNSIATGILSQRCFRVPISDTSDGLRLKLMDESSRANGSRYGGIQVYWAAEAATVTATKPTFREEKWELNKLFGLFYATEEVLRDANALAAVVNKWFPMEFGFKLDDGIFNGTGAGMPLGILNAGCTVSQAIETGQVRATTPILYENVIKMYARLLNSSDANSVWYTNRALLPYLMMMVLPVGTGGAPVFLPPGGASGSPYMTLLGKPLIPIEQAQAPASAGDLVLADLNEYLIIDKGGINSAVSIHVRFIYDEQTFRWTYRFDGRPIKNKTLTPFKGGATATQGPFVALAAS
jgi:HK97 family phage major capsid protein